MVFTLVYHYITVALLCSSIYNYEFTPLINNMNVCISEEYRVCFIPDHCIYFEKYYDTTTKEFTTINPKVYYDLQTNQHYTFSNVNRSNRDLVKYYNQLEVESSSVPLYNTSYLYHKKMNHNPDIEEMNEWLKFVL